MNQMRKGYVATDPLAVGLSRADIEGMAYRAATGVEPHRSNPYPAGSREYKSWETGLRAAREQFC
jgi:hypothetical protein